MQIIRHAKIVSDHWTHVADGPIPSEGCISVSFARWKDQRTELLSRVDDLGLRVSSEDPIEEVTEDLDRFQMIGLDFPVFTDGRLFSVARTLRDHYGYQGEIRAMGGFIRDQIFFLSRVGVDSFEMEEGSDLDGALSALDDFSVSYQISSEVRN